MASCSSTTVLMHAVEEEPTPRLTFPRSVLETSSLARLVGLVSQDLCVAAWKELPVTERLEIAESLLHSVSANEFGADETIFKCVSVLCLFASSNGWSAKDYSSPLVQEIISSTLDRLRQALPRYACARDEIGLLRDHSIEGSSMITKWIPPAIVVTVGIAFLFFGPRITTVV